jgi:hypothetical protein
MFFLFFGTLYFREEQILKAQKAATEKEASSAQFRSVTIFCQKEGLLVKEIHRTRESPIRVP